MKRRDQKLKIKVKYFTFLRELIGRREEEYEFEKELTVEELIEFIAKKYGKEAKNYLFEENGKLKEILSFLVNGKSITSLNGPKTKLKDRDILAIIPPVGGG